MAMNRETRRYLQRQGTLGPEGEPVVDPKRREQARQQFTRNQQQAARQRTKPGDFLRDVRGELRRVAWPTRAETINYSVVVVVTLAVLMGLIFLLDTGFSDGMLFIFKK